MAGRNLSLCGLYLNFSGVRSFVDELRSIGIRATDISVALPDGSITSASLISIDPQRLEAAVRSSGTVAAPTRSGYSARVTSLASGLTKTLFTLGVPVYDSERVESKIRNGGILVSVRCHDSALEQVRDVLIRTGAQDVSFSRDAKTELERCAALRTEPYTAPSVNGWQQPSAHA